MFCFFCDFFGYSLIMTVTMFVLCFFWSIPVSIQLLGPTNRSNGYAWSNMDYGNTEMSTEGLLSKKCYHILLVTFCFRGHFNPASGVARALSKRSHKVTVIVTDQCSDLVEKYMPEVTDYHIRPVVPNINLPSDPFEAMKRFDEFNRLNNTIKMFEMLDHFINSSGSQFDLIYGNAVSSGIVLAGRKHNIPVVSQVVGPLMPTAAKYPSLLHSTDLPMENTEEQPSLWSVVRNAIYISIYEAAVSYKVFNALQDFHAAEGWEQIPYGFGRFPFSYVQKYSLLISHGAPPLTRAEDHFYRNAVSIGFIPDDIMYPPLSEELSDWLEKADGPVVFISLGTVIALTQEESETMFSQLVSQKRFFFIWAVTTPMLQSLNISKTLFLSRHLIVGRYLPQGNILRHSKVKLFVTHCGANSVQDAVYEVKPMVTYPGFGDQPLTSNLLNSKKVAKLLKTFTYKDMEPLLNEQLKEPNYSQMIARLSVMKREQIKQGGFSKAVTVIEDYIENRTVLNRSDNFDNVIGFPLGQMMFICSTTAVFSADNAL
ncbi:uncharacterized protein LOC142336606 [Convolutriloba macropyga]|uniref:uncharacterized protein LOC142336606 n=1 Tax=Convolutriloba macropyga TaxID=536237 RepID=UPI003F527F04